MSNPYQLVVLDWEGTISDTLGPILNTVHTEARALGFGDLEFAQARQYVELGIVSALRKLFPNLSALQHEQLLQAVHISLHTHPAEVCLIPGALEFIERLHEAGLDIAIATNKGQHSLARAIQVSGLDKFIKVTRSAGQVAAKPAPQMLEEIMQEFGQNPSSTIMIGDSVVDMEMARSINVAAIGVDFYHQQGEALKAAGALEVFDDYQQVARFLELPNT